MAFIILPLFYFDKRVILWVSNFYKCNLDIYQIDQAIVPSIKFISNGVTLFLMSFALFLYGRSRNQKLQEAGKSLLIGLVSAGAVVQVLKHIIGRARPRITFDSVFIGPSVKSGYDSFPSGHTAAAFCMAFILSRYLPKYRVVFYLFAVIVGIDRIDGLSHFPSDVAAGAIIGVIIGKVLSIKTSAPEQQISDNIGRC